MKFAIPIREETLELIQVLNGGVLPDFKEEQIGRKTWKDPFTCVVFTVVFMGTSPSIIAQPPEIVSEHDLQEGRLDHSVQGHLIWSIK